MVKFSKRPGRPRHSAEISETRGGHRRCSIREAGDHQTISGVEEDNLHVDVCRGCGSGRYLFVGSVDVLIGALPGNPKDEPFACGRYEKVEIREAAEALAVARIYVRECRNPMKV